jgi:hypothetical protein
MAASIDVYSCNPPAASHYRRSRCAPPRRRISRVRAGRRRAGVRAMPPWLRSRLLGDTRCCAMHALQAPRHRQACGRPPASACRQFTPVAAIVVAPCVVVLRRRLPPPRSTPPPSPTEDSASEGPDLALGTLDLRPPAAGDSMVAGTRCASPPPQRWHICSKKPRRRRPGAALVLVRPLRRRREVEEEEGARQHGGLAARGGGDPSSENITIYGMKSFLILLLVISL